MAATNVRLPISQVRQRKRAEGLAARGRGDQDIKNADGDGGGREVPGGGAGHPPAPGKSDHTAATAAEHEGKTVKAGDADGSSGDDKGDVGIIGEEELTKHTPEVRTAIYREMAEQKKEKEDRQRENLPKDRDFELEQVQYSCTAVGRKEITRGSE